MHHVLGSMRALNQHRNVTRRLLIGAGINPQVVGDSRRRVHSEQVARLFKSVQLELDDEFMGFSAMPCRVGAFKTMCELVRHSHTLGELLNRAADFYRLANHDLDLGLNVTADQAVFSIKHRSPELDPEHFLREFLLVIWHRFPSWYLGEVIRLREIHFSFVRPEHHRELLVMFPGRLKYGQSRDALVFDAHYLDRALIRSHSEVDYYARNAPADVMTIPGADNSLERQIERIVELSSPGRLEFPKVVDVAGHLGLAGQTLYRRLKAEGTSYQEIKDNIRRERAIRHLVDDDMSVERVSEIVGFSDARSFSRAFKYWTGMSPRRYKQSFRYQG